MRIEVKMRQAPLEFAGKTHAEKAVLCPGVNEVTEEDLKILANHGDILRWYEDQGIVVPHWPEAPAQEVETRGGSEPTEPADNVPKVLVDSIDELSWQKAVARVEAETDLAVLEAWSETEDRESVKKAIEERCNELLAE